MGENKVKDKENELITDKIEKLKKGIIDENETENNKNINNRENKVEILS